LTCRGRVFRRPATDGTKEQLIQADARGLKLTCRNVC